MYQRYRSIALAQHTGSLSSYLAESRVLHREATSRRFLVILPDRWDDSNSRLSVPAPTFHHLTKGMAVLTLAW